MARRIIIFANGEFPYPQQDGSHIQSGDVIICADGGTRHALSLGLTPDLVIGDLDSLAPRDREQLVQEGVRIEAYPRDKDYTDLELALMAAQARRPESVLLLAALGGRLDQTLANILLLAHPRFVKMPITLISGPERAWVVDDGLVVRGKPGDVLSVLPLSPDVAGLTYRGDLRWLLDDARLPMGSSRGVSNVFTGPEAHLSLRSGIVLVIHRQI